MELELFFFIDTSYPDGSERSIANALSRYSVLPVLSRQWWRTDLIFGLTLSQSGYSVEYRPTKDLDNPDTLSRLPSDGINFSM